MYVTICFNIVVHYLL